MSTVLTSHVRTDSLLHGQHQPQCIVDEDMTTTITYNFSIVFQTYKKPATDASYNTEHDGYPLARRFD